MKPLFPLAALTFVLCACNAQTPAAVNIDTSVVNSDTTSASGSLAIEWWAKNMGNNSNGAPHNILTLRPVSHSGDVLYRTECDGTTLVQGVQDMGDSIASIQCWWAGGGDQFGVYIDEKEQILIRHRTVDEEVGYGEWEDLRLPYMPENN